MREESRRGGRIQHIYLDELYHGTGVFSNTANSCLKIDNAAYATAPWFATSPDMPFLETAHDKPGVWGTRSREMKLEAEPRPCFEHRMGE